jgi:hypothetical protein
MSVGDYVSVFLAVLALGTLVVALHQWREVVRRRHVDMYWRIFDAYNSDELRASRDAFAKIETDLGLSEPSGQTGRIPTEELPAYSETYWKDFYRSADDARRRLDRLARARLRFYAQTGVLLRKGLVDEDLLFGLIGPPLDVDMRLLDILIAANREGHKFPRMYEEVEHAHRDYEDWRDKKGPALSARLDEPE